MFATTLVAMGVWLLPGVSESHGHLTQRRCELQEGGFHTRAPQPLQVCSAPRNWAPAHRSLPTGTRPRFSFAHVHLSLKPHVPLAHPAGEDHIPPYSTLRRSSCTWWSSKAGLYQYLRVYVLICNDLSK